MAPAATGLWLSLAVAVPDDEARRFAELLCDRYCPGMALAPGVVETQVALQPGLQGASGKWAAFIYPGVGASFADDPGPAIPPPLAGQVGFLEGLESIGKGDFRQALAGLEPAFAAPQLTSPAAQPDPPGRWRRAGERCGFPLQPATARCDAGRHCPLPARETHRANALPPATVTIVRVPFLHYCCHIA